MDSLSTGQVPQPSSSLHQSFPTGSLGGHKCVGGRRHFLSGMPAPRLGRSEVLRELADRTPGAVSALGSLTTKSVGCLLSWFFVQRCESNKSPGEVFGCR